MNNKKKRRKKNDGNVKAFISGIGFMVALYGIGHFGYKAYRDFVDDIGTGIYQYNVIMNTDKYDNVIKELEKEFSINIEDDKKDELLVMNAIYTNNELSTHDKNVFYGFYSIVEDIQSMDRERAYESLSKVKVIRNKNVAMTSNSTLGDYSYGSEVINIYAESDPNDRILVHEGIHCMFNNSKTESLPRFFNEGMTELLSNEYFSEDPFLENNSYPIEVAYVKMLCEIVGTDTVLQAFVSGDFNKITDEMDKYNKTDMISSTILDIYEDSFIVFERKQQSRYTDENRQKAYAAILSIYENTDNPSKDKKSFNYLYELSSSGFKDSPISYYSNYVKYYGILEKAYFSSDLKSQFQYPTVVNYDHRHFVKVKSKLSGNLTN